MATKDADIDLDTSSLDKHGIHLLSGEFDFESSTKTISWILEQNLKKKKLQHLTLIINSYGGDIVAAFAIIDIMRGSSIPVRTVGLGTIMSSGLMTFMAGAKGYRILTPNTSIMSHQFSSDIIGKSHELVAIQKEFDLTTKRMINHYKLCTNLSEEIIRQKLLPSHDVYLSAEEALELNICDDIKYLA